ncbi:hypothetical protein E4U53_000168 [Claviceps sorghi]|nr:hypothetical protein E4U53_000168 [Claviceps sorghi]
MDSSTAESQPPANDINTSPRRDEVMHGEKLTVQTQKPFNTLSALGIGYGTTNTAVGLVLVLGTTIPLGGSPLFFWGFLVMVVIALATATSLAELASAMPHAGGQYIWSRLAWTISRDGGFPLRRHLARVLPAPFHTPLWSLAWSAACSALFGCLYLASDVAFSSLIATGLLLLYFSYGIPVVLLLVRRRSAFRHGPFWCPVLGCVSNLVMLAWTLVAAVFYCFPYQSAVEPERMNYVSVVLAVVALFICTLWFSFANRHYDVGYHGQ